MRASSAATWSTGGPRLCLTQKGRTAAAYSATACFTNHHWLVTPVFSASGLKEHLVTHEWRATCSDTVLMMVCRRLLDIEGWASDMTLLRQQVAATNRKLNQMRLASRLPGWYTNPADGHSWVLKHMVGWHLHLALAFCAAHGVCYRALWRLVRLARGL